MIVSFLSDFALAQSNFKFEKHRLTGEFSSELPTSHYAVYVTDWIRSVPTKKSCDDTGLASDWSKAVKVDLFPQHAQDLGWNITLECLGTTKDGVTLKSVGFVYALNEAGDKFLRDTYTNKSYFFNGVYWNFFLPRRSALNLRVMHWGKKPLQNQNSSEYLITEGFLTIPFHKIDAFFTEKIKQLELTSPSERRTIMFKFLSELMPDVTPEKLNEHLDLLGPLVGSLSFYAQPIFSLGSRSYAEIRFSWHFAYVCPNQVCY